MEIESTSETNHQILLLHPSSSSSSSSSSSLPRRPHYDVFLSFRGEDTRKSFTDHLFAGLCRVGVHTFRDAEELRKGEDISVDLIKAIWDSKISIIVFSKTYASSRWCLEELVEILECKDKVNQVVLPVFYDVDPSEIRNQTGGFGDALTLLQQRFGAEKASRWKAALTKVATLSGWDLLNDSEGYESKFINKIVDNVLQVVNYTYLNVAKYPIGIHFRVREILSLLQSEANDGVRMIGIYGMGGVGKTTLAKAVFNQIYTAFQGSCFLEDVVKQCGEGGRVGLRCLQKQLLCKTLNTTRLEVDLVDQGINLIKGRLGSKKALIVVDDVDHESQLEALVGDRDWFGSGSIIIITTRNVNLLNGPGRNCEKYNVALLSSEESLQLFSWHAFKNPNPLETFVELSDMIVSYVGGLPLALTVLGSHFRARSSLQEWRDDFEKLKKIQHNDILKILKISYDALDGETQRIFLDIACFFTNARFTQVDIVVALNGFGYSAQSGILTLIDKCLLREDAYMHDLVRDMGREIVRHESPMQIEKRSRLFSSNEVLDVLVNNKGTEAIETMIIDLPMEVHFRSKVFSKMTKLRALEILSMNMKGSLKYLSNELRLLHWRNFPLRRMSSNLCLKKLVILEITDSNIMEFQPNVKNFGRLEILMLNGCQQLKKAPNFTGAHSIKKLSLDGCSNLVELPQSIGDLKNLVRLYLGGCKNLKVLPNSICMLKSLKLLDLEECSKIKELPTNFGELEQLCFLRARGTLVKHLHFSCRSLRYLGNLQLGQFVPPPAPSVTIRIPSIGHQDANNSCSRLHCLCVPHHYLQHLDLQISHEILPILTILDLSYSDFNTMPSNICHLSHLKYLRLAECQNLQVIQDLPPNLQYLFAWKCPLLEKVSDLSGLQLREMCLDDCRNLIELPGVENLDFIKTISIKNCISLTSNSWFVNFFKAQFQNVNFREVQMRVSKGMVPQFLWSNRVVGSDSSNCSLPLLFLKKKLMLIVLYPREYDCWCSLKNKTTGVQLLRYKLVNPWVFLGPSHDYDDMVLECKVYDHFTQPIKVQELEVFIELKPLYVKVVEENLSIQTCIAYEDEGEVCFFLVNPNVGIKLPTGTVYTQRVSPTPNSNMEQTEPQNRRYGGSCKPFFWMSWFS